MVSMFLRVISFVKVTPGVHSPSCLMSFLTWKNSSSRDSVKHVSCTCPLASWETLLVDTSKAINNVSMEFNYGFNEEARRDYFKRRGIL